MTADDRILLMGLRGSGKSTVGALLARASQRDLIDLDDVTLGLLREELGVGSIAEVFERHGESVFREAEVRALREVLERTANGRVVISLGGGTPTALGAEELLRSSGVTTVYLRLSPGVLATRLRGEIDARRPALLGGADPIAEIEEVWCRRDPMYRSLAKVIIEDDGPPERVARLVLERLSRTD